MIVISSYLVSTIRVHGGKIRKEANDGQQISGSTDIGTTWTLKEDVNQWIDRLEEMLTQR